MKITPNELAIRLNWPLDMKIEWACKIISEFIIHTKGQCYLSFSAGKDSETVEHIISKIYDGTYKHITPRWDKVVSYRKPVKVFSNTGLEYPEIVEHAKSFDDVVIVKPLMGFTRVISEIGVAVGSKKTARMISDLRNPTPDNEKSRKMYLTGVKSDGTITKSFKLAKRWYSLITAPFKVSYKCCDILKKEPFSRFEKETGKRPIVGTTTDEGDQRRVSYLQTGCNTLDEGKEKSRPLSIWREDDIWEYSYRWGFKFASVYYDQTVDYKMPDGSIKPIFVPGEKRTGCIFCLFGITEEDKKTNNRIQRVAIRHPKLYDVVINKCGLGVVLKFIGVEHKPYLHLTCGKQQNLFGETPS